MATATVIERSPAHGAVTRPNVTAVGTIIWLSSELMFFAALFAMYFTVRAVQEPAWPAPGVTLDIPFSGTFTVILVLSSVTCQLGVFAAERGQVRRSHGLARVLRWGMREWFVLTFVMGLIFVLGQANEYRGHTFTPQSHAYGSVYYITTGFHGLHVIGGLIAFLIVLARSRYGPYTPQKATSAIVVSYYWHFVDVVWIGLYATIYLIQ